MKAKQYGKIISLILVIATLVTTLPLTVFAETVELEKTKDLYVKSIRLAQAETKNEAKAILEGEGYIFLDGNLNEGTGQDGIWMGYTTTTDPTEAIYDLKVMNMKGGFTLTSVEEALRAQETAFAQMATDLNYLVEEFIAAYNNGSIAALKAYNSLNFFRVVAGETELIEENGLGYQLVHGGISLSGLTEIIMLCDSDILDSVIKILTTGIQLENVNWMEQLSKKGPYDSDTVYGTDEAEIKRRAEQLLTVIQFYAQAYNAMDASGLIPDDFDDNGDPVYNGENKVENIPAEEADIKKIDESRYKLYKVVFDELAKYSYGEGGDTLKDFFLSMASDSNAKKLYPLASVLTDGEFAALSYGCFIEVASGVVATSADFDNYDEVYAELTKEVKSLYLYQGVDSALINDDAVIAFTDAASRHMAITGELEFYENETDAENAWETGKMIAKAISALGTATIGLAKITYGVTMLISSVSSTVAASVESGMLGGVMKFCTLISGVYASLVVAAAALVVIAITYIIMVKLEDDDTEIDWEKNPIPEYIYDVKEVNLHQTSTNDGIASEMLRKTVFTIYEAVTDTDDMLIDLNAFSDDASQWISLYVSYDRQGDNAKPIKAEDLKVKKGNGETPSGYEPLTAFGQVIAYNLNQWDEKDEANGVYLFYKQDKNVAVESNVTYYIYDVYLQQGESDAHCIDLLQAAGYTPININLSPNLMEDVFYEPQKIYTYLGYKTTTNPNSAIRDLRIEYGPSQGEIKHGSASYAECGSNGKVTLYATKYSNAGTPLLAGGLICVNDRSDAPEGYEPVNFFAGGPAVSFNCNRWGVFEVFTEYFIYFLPETTFKSGAGYLGGVSYISIPENAVDYPMFSAGDYIYNYLEEKYGNTYNSSNEDINKINAMFDYIEDRMGYTYMIELDKEDEGDFFHSMYDAVLLYKTYNPYRAIYDIKATGVENSGASLNFESVGYRTWNITSWRLGKSLIGASYNELEACYFAYNQNLGDAAPHMSQTLYVSGNPSSGNVYKNGSMSEMTPLYIYNFNCYDDTYEVDYQAYGVTPVTDVFTNSKDALVFDNEDTFVNFSFYFKNRADDRPYVSNVTAVDLFTLYRSINSKENVIGATSKIPEGMLLTQLANQGATNFCGTSVHTYENLADGYITINTTKFGFTRTDKGSDALRDVFIYFGGIINNDPPKELYRGSVKYKLLCQIPYNLTPYNNAPEIGIYLYGTTDSRAGSRIVDFEVSTTPFIEGYETIRTMDGGSLIQEVHEYSKYCEENSSLNSDSNFFEKIASIFSIHDVGNIHILENTPFYLHIQRENSTPRESKPYIGEVYITTAENKEDAMDKLFDMGAEGFVDMNLNKGTVFGSNIYMGYSYTANPDEAIKDIVAYHKKNPPATLTDDAGRTFTLVSNIDLNKGAGGDYIYLYTTKQDDGSSDPIVTISANTKISTSSSKTTWIDGSEKTVVTECTKKWESTTNSDLNKGAGGAYVYLMYGTLDSDLSGSYTEPNYGKDKTYTRKEITDLSATGKYIGALFVMDKNTIRQEKLASGVASDDCTCAKITDQEVFDRLREMGATTIIETPINITGLGFAGAGYEDNDNKVFIGYSRTDDSKKAIKNIAIKAEIFSRSEPSESIDIDKKTYKLVAEAATKVTELPRAINLIGLEDCQDMSYPKLYLYYSTVGTGDPIYDICIDSDPLKNGWNTVRSSNKTDAYLDICNQIDEICSDKAQGTPSSNYEQNLLFWMYGIKNIFDLDDMVSSFYIHVKKFATETIEEEKPYIGEIFLAYGDTEQEALANLVAYDPDGYIEIDLNNRAGGDYVYLGYKRVAKAKDALTDLVIFQGKKPALTKRITIGDTTVKYTLVADVDLNKDAGGKYLYLYATDSDKMGSYITNLKVEENTESYLKCGVEIETVKLAEGSKMTDEHIDLNKNAGGDYLYLIMNRETELGHNGEDTGEFNEKLPTCGDDGYHTKHLLCKDCGITYEETTIIPATGNHIDADRDGDHKCDSCGKNNLTTHTRGEAKEENRKEATEDTDGSYNIVYYCTECNSKLSESKVIIPAGTDPAILGASILGTGSIIAISSFAVLAVAVAVFVYFKKRKQENLNNE